MSDLNFEWDSRKGASNRHKHQVTFEEASIVRQHYDLTKMKGEKNPFAKRLKKQISIRIGVDTLEYFKKMSEETGIPYQNLIDSYLADCAEKHLKLQTKWG